MAMSVDTQIVCADEDQPPPSTIEQWVGTALTHCAPDLLPAAELTVRIVDEQEIQQLNRQYRGKDTPTNVLSFPADLPDYIDLPLLGDVVICASVVNREAQQQHKAPQHHWAHMIVHGCLHLLGHDHIEEADAKVMESLEIAILAKLDIADPYIKPDRATDKMTTNKTVNL